MMLAVFDERRNLVRIQNGRATVKVRPDVRHHLGYGTRTPERNA